jgi:hypothetical protein
MVSTRAKRIARAHLSYISQNRSDEPFDAVEERAAFTELTTVLESARESLRYIHIGSTFAPNGCMVFGIMPGQTPVSRGIFQELVVPT